MKPIAPLLFGIVVTFIPVAASAEEAIADVSPAEVAPALPPAPPKPVITLVIDANLTTQQVTVSGGGRTLHAWPISSGRAGYATPTGKFKATWMSRMWYSKQYDDAPMPHSIFFNAGIAFHGTQATGMLGRPASHGCIRLAPGSAATLYALVRKHGLQSTEVIVRGKAKTRDPEVARRREPSGRPYAAYGYSGYRSSSPFASPFVYPGDAYPSRYGGYYRMR